MAHRFLRSLFPLVDAIAETFGKNCEVVLHDFANPDQSIVKIANGHVTGRDIGGPATDWVLPFIGKPTKRQAFVGYRTRTNNATELKSTTVLITAGNGKVVGALCINLDLTPYLAMKHSLDQFCLLSDSQQDTQAESPEKFESRVDDLVQQLLKASIDKVGKPVAYMRREDKLQVIRDLKLRGLFTIKGAAKRVSAELRVSLATIYKYLEEAT